jgi:hypothetical protein
VISILNDNGKGTIKIYTTNAVEIRSDKTVDVKSETITVKGKSITLEADDKVEIKAQTITIEGKQSVAAKAMEVKLEGQTSAKVSGAGSLDLESSGITNLKGSLVKIN